MLLSFTCFRCSSLSLCTPLSCASLCDSRAKPSLAGRVDVDFRGSQSIVAELTSLPFQQCQHRVTTVDCQASGPTGGMLVFVNGNLQLTLKFSKMFHLMQTTQGSFYVLNDIFRLNYA